MQRDSAQIMSDRALSREGKHLAVRLLWHERRTVGIALVCSMFAAALEGTGIGLLVPLLQSILEPGGEPLQSGIRWIDQWILGVDAQPLQRLYQVSAAIFASIVFRSVLGYIGQIASLRATERVLHRLRLMIFEQLSEVSLRFYSSTRSGDLMNTVTTEVQRLRILFQTVSQIVIRGLVMVAYAGLALWMSWQMTAIALVFLALLSLSLRYIIRKTKREGFVIAKANSKVASIVGEFVSGIKTVKAFSTEAHEMERFREASVGVTNSVVRTGQAGASVKPVAEALASGVLIVLIVISVRLLVMGGDLAVPTLLAFLFAIFRLLPLVNELNNARGRLANVHGSWTHTLEFLAAEDKPYLTDGLHTSGTLRDAIRFENVSFEYESGRPVLHNINLKIYHGETVALVGASGAGKSTLVDLIPRFADPTQGRIYYDDVDIRDFRLDTLRAKLAVVSQDTFLFNDTVAGNIAYGLEAVPYERIREVSEQANALHFIEELPKGFDTVLGDRGVRLSGGQRQRIAIARALLRDPEILILDEATSALDSVTEQLVQKSLERLMTGRTVIVIAHRLSTLEHADQVIVLEGGVIVEKGRYEDLIEQEGRLWEYHCMQYQAA